MKAKDLLVLAVALTLMGGFISWMSMERFSEASGYARVAQRNLFDRRIKTYILTTSCERRCDHLTRWIPQGTFMLDADTAEVAPRCKTHSQWDYKTVPNIQVGRTPGPAPAKKYRSPENDKERLMLLKDPDQKFRTPEFQDWMVQIEAKYRNKYAQTLRNCVEGTHELCMLLEDDIVSINKPDVNLFRLAAHTIPKYSGPEVLWDCTKRGNGWRSRRIDGNKCQCRIVHRDYAGCLADYFDTSGAPADIALASGKAYCNMKQKWFLRVQQHVGRNSSMGHDN